MLPRPSAGADYTATDITALLGRWRQGEGESFERVVDRAYGELRRLAQSRLRRESSTLTLDATELVHEAYLCLQDKDHSRIRDREHFLAVYSMIMRRILVDHARCKKTQKRGSGQRLVELDEGLPSPEGGLDWLLVDQLLTGLQRLDKRKARIVELKFFGGLTVDEIATAMQVSSMTIVREWRQARAWLTRELKKTGES